MLNEGLTAPLTEEEYAVLRERAWKARSIVLTATTLAGSGHPGGSLSSMEIYTLLYGTARIRPHEPRWSERDRIVISHGHTSPGAYAALALAGFFDPQEVAAHFRQTGSVFEGHVERAVPGIEWSTGNLGQGLSAGVGFALAARAHGAPWHTYVVMSDGEQMKGQVGEARRLAAKERLASVTAVVDWNRIQISGATDQVMPVDIPALWRADGWLVHECDGHDIEALHAAVAAAVSDGVPSVVLAHTTIGKGVSFMEGRAEFHGRGLTEDEYRRAIAELGGDPGALALARERRAAPCVVQPLEEAAPPVSVAVGTPREYDVSELVDCRSAWGRALADIAEQNPDAPILVLDCDLMSSVKTDAFAALRPEGFVQCGVGEHNAATVAGAASIVPGTLVFWADFGVFGIDEVYNQQRLNALNGARLNVVVTHCGVDVGEDGKTHHCLDYVGALRGLTGWRVVVPADANQTDRAARALAGEHGCVCLAMGRSKIGIVADRTGEPLFGGEYRFRYGEIVWARSGTDACVLTMGTVAGEAVRAADRLRKEAGVQVAVGIVACPLHLDEAAMREAVRIGRVLTVEDHHVRTGLGASVAEWLALNGVGVRFERLGVDALQPSGPARELLGRLGLDADGIARALARLVSS